MAGQSVTFRSGRSDDAAAAAEILAAEEVSLRGRSAWDRTTVGDWWRLVDLERDSWVVEDADRALAFAVVLRRGDVADAWVCVHPAGAGRGLGTALLDRAERRVRETQIERVHAVALAENDPGRRLLERRGYREVRRYYLMIRELDGEPEEPEWAPGFTVSTFRAEYARDFHGVLEEAFAEEWNFRPRSFDEWKRDRVEAPDFDGGLWFLVRDGEDVVAVLRGDASRFGAGWVGALGVRPAWRKRGLGLALLRHAFREFHRRGERRVGLGVDASNPTGAIRLYERAGMHVELEDLTYAKELA